MTQGILQNTLLALGLFSFSSAPASPSASTLFNPGIEQEYVYVVKSGDTLASIAEKYYGDVKYWVVLWNDNDWIESYNVIEPGWALKIRAEKPEFTDELSETNRKKLEAAYASVVSQNASRAQVTTLPSPTQGQVQKSAPVASGPLSDAQMQFLGQCEAGMDPAKNTGNGYYGAFQFSYGTWKSMNTGYERADMAPLEVQKDAVQRLLARSSIYTQFPGCARKMQSLGMI